MMLFYDTGKYNPFMNMALDEVLLKQEKPVLRLYQWDPPGLSVGRFQLLDDIDTGFCKKNGIDIVRRLTGGKTVLHDIELTYSFIIDEDSMPESVIESYELISNALILGLKKINIEAHMNKSPAKRKSAICFTDPSYNEILVNNRKIIGSAQARLKGKILQHGAILMEINYEKLVNCFMVRDKKETLEDTKSRVTAIKQENDNITLNELKRSIISGFTEVFRADIINRELTQEQLREAGNLVKNKYGSRKWLYQR